MSVLDAAVDAGVRQKNSSTVRDCPPFVAPEFFERRPVAWRSGACGAGSHHFEILSEWNYQTIAQVVAPVASSLRTMTKTAATSANRYWIIRRPNRHLPFALYYNEERLTTASRPERLQRFLTWHINRQMIDKSSIDHVVLHAAAATRAGITVVLPGDQEHGKTTTVAGLLREGFHYVTDEAVAIDPATLNIFPFPKALSIDDGSWFLFPECEPRSAFPEIRQWQVPAEQLGSRSICTPVAPAKVVVFPRYVAGSKTTLIPISRPHAARALAEATFHFQDDPARNLSTLAAVVKSCTVARLVIGSLPDAVLAVEQLVSQVLIEEL